MNLFQAEDIAQTLVEQMRPHCERIQIAGSIRRQKPNVGDIEIVAIPKWEPRTDPADLFGAEIPYNVLFGDWSASAGIEWLKGWNADGKFWQGMLPQGIKLDLFLVNDRNWGNQLLVRTGCAEFSRAVVTHAAEQGFPFRDGYVRGRDGRQLEMPTERDVFALLDLEYVVPEARTGKEALRMVARRAAA